MINYLTHCYEALIYNENSTGEFEVYLKDGPTDLTDSTIVITFQIIKIKI